MLPSLPHKVCMFTRRLVIYNETSSILQPIKLRRNEQQKKRRVAALWHEGIAERKAADLTSCYVALLKSNRDIEEFAIFCDNYAPQNKSWVVLFVLVQPMQREDLSVEITFQYFRTGYTARVPMRTIRLNSQEAEDKKAVEDLKTGQKSSS